MKVFLFGLPGSGKTTMGKELAKRIGVSFIDLDEAIQKAAGKSIEEIFKIHKEAYFRKLESSQLKELCQLQSDFVLATGGGTPCFADNLEIMNRTGISVFIDVAPKVIAQRLLKTDLKTRPLFAAKRPDNLKDAIEFMRSQRISYYRQAHHTVGPDSSAAQIEAMIKTGTQS
jgi:shikimate kinase